jgi:hypothetical protein
MVPWELEEMEETVLSLETVMEQLVVEMHCMLSYVPCRRVYL